MDDTRDLGLLETSAVVVGVAREIVLATGADRVRFLQGIVTGNIAGTPVGAGCHAALLTTKAHVVAEMWAFVRESNMYLAVPRGEAATVSQALSRYAIMDDFAAASLADFTLMAFLGPRAGALLAEAGYATDGIDSRPAWSHADVTGPGGVLWLARVRQLGVDGYWIGGSAAIAARLSDTLGTLGVARLSTDAAEAARVAAGEPAWGREITGDYFPMEVGLDDAIDYTKGCFLGQEPIVRIRDRGHVNWRLVRLDLGAPGKPAAGGYAPVPGDRLETDAKAKAGRLTSVALLPDGKGIALALAHVSIAPGAEVRIVAAEGTGIAIATVAA